MAGVPKLVLIGDTLVTLYENMVRIRRFAERMGKAADEGLVAESSRPAVGLEAVAAGVEWHLGEEDLVLTGGSALSCALAKGVPAKELVAQYYGRAGGCGGGAGGGRYFAAPQAGLLGVLDDSASPLLHAVGAAVAVQQQQQKHLAVALFGAGALRDGATHEALRVAARWKLPALFIGQVPAATAGENLTRWAAMGKSYGLASVAANGRVVAEVYAAANEAARRARDGAGPALLLFDVATAPSPQPLEPKDDPVQLLRNQLLETEALGEPDLEEIEAKADKEVESACTVAAKAAPLDLKRAARRLTSE